jgi:hypothetical protein
MRLARNLDLETAFMDGIREAMSEPREGLHRSSLFPCARAGKAREVLNMKLDDDEVLFFAQGRAVHAFVVGHRFVPLERPLTLDGVIDTPDGWTSLTETVNVNGKPVPVEFKSTRLSSRDFPDKVNQPLPRYKGALGDYLWQLLDHCLFAGTETGVLAVLFFMGDYGAKRKWCPKCKARVSFMECKACGWKGRRIDFRAYDVTFDEASELAPRRPEVLLRRDQYLSTDDPMAVPPTPCWQCESCKPGKAIKCPWFGKKVAA